MAKRAVLVTGASRGIGRAVAQAFAELGDRVAVHHRDSAGLAQDVRAGLAGRGHTVVETEMAAADLNSARGEEIRAQSPFNRVATPEEIAAAVVYLASDAAEWASGTILDLNGASYLR